MPIGTCKLCQLTKDLKDSQHLDVLQAVPATVKRADWDTYSAKDTPAIDRDKLAYFAISVFWRASIHTWELESGEKVKIELGAKYNEELRNYLRGATPVPRNVSLQVVVCSDQLNRATFFAPAENQKHKDRTFIFVARGIMYFFRVSNTLADYQKRLSIVNSAERWITKRDCGNKPVWQGPN
jgi:hypothetical protein